MRTSDPQSAFVGAVQEAFSFLVATLGFEQCGLLPEESVDPRDGELRVRYRNQTNTVDLVNSLTRGLGLDVAKRDPSADPGDCRHAGTSPLVDFERFLLARHGSELEPPLPEMKRHKVFVTMYSRHPILYARIVSAKLSEAVGVMAARFKKYGPELLSGDLDLIWRETRGISSQKPP